MSTIKVFKKGEALYREGEKATTVYLVQSGSVSLHLTRQKQTIELCIVGTNQIVGEHALSGGLTHPHSAVCTSETKVIELPVEAVKAQLESASQLFKFLAKGLSDKLKVVFKELQSARLERDNTPCPPDQTAKIFGALYHSARLKSETKKEGTVTASFPAMKQYAQRVFLESPKRLEQTANIFVKLGVAKYEWTKNEDDPEAVEEIGFLHFKDADALSMVEQFFEFYQYYYFKGGKGELLKTDDRVIQLTQALVDVGTGEALDRNGSVRLDYSKVVEKVKDSMGLQLNGDHFTLLENKGLFVKRQSTDTGVFLQFEFKEFERTLKIWRVMREVERWNDKGFVDPNEPIVEPGKPKKPGQLECHQCSHPYDKDAKFCSECGAKLNATAAA
jgi:CRP-like cAMP-binding protein